MTDRDDAIITLLISQAPVAVMFFLSVKYHPVNWIGTGVGVAVWFLGLFALGNVVSQMQRKISAAQ